MHQGMVVPQPSASGSTSGIIAKHGNGSLLVSQFDLLFDYPSLVTGTRD
jgi:hypothetical protein